VRLPSHLVPRIAPQHRFSGHLELGKILERRLDGQMALDPLSFGQLAVADPPGGCFRVKDHPGFGRELVGRNFQRLGGEFEEHGLCLGRRGAQGWAKPAVVIEPQVPMSKGQRSVSPMTISTLSSGTSSSSATIWGREVIGPWPISILPVKQVTRPSSPIRTKR